MKLISGIPVFCFLAFLIPTAPAFSEEGKERSFFLLGNSLTWDTRPSLLDGDVQWHVDCGKSLPYMYENPGEPCVKSSTLWPDALEAKQYDVISLQVHYGSTLQEDAVVISALIDLQPKAEIVIHTGWARSQSRVEEYAGEVGDGKMHHSPMYFQELLAELRKFHPHRVFRLTHAQDLLQQVAEDIENEQAPFEKVEDLYRDAIHMNHVTGRYLMHNAMRYALGQPRSASGFDGLPPEVKTYLDSVLDTLEERVKMRESVVRR